MVSKRILALTVAGLLLLPIAIVLLLGTSSLLTAMQDPAAAIVLQRIGLGLGLIWLLGLIGLILALGINAVDSGNDRPHHHDSEP